MSIKKTLLITASAALMMATPVVAEEAKTPEAAVPGGHSDGTMTKKLSDEVPTMEAKDGATSDTNETASDDTKSNTDGDKVKGGHTDGTLTKELGETVPKMKTE